MLSPSQLSEASTVCPRVLLKRRPLRIVAELPRSTTISTCLDVKQEAQPQPTTAAERRPLPSRAFLFERAKSGRSCCRRCKQTIAKNELRLGLLTFFPHKNTRWFHTDKCCQHLLGKVTFDDFWGVKQLPQEDILVLKQLLDQQQTLVHPTQVIATVTGTLDLPRFASAITERYNRFRSFRFGLQESEMYSKNWRWRCFLSTMLVCNTHETSMLAFTDKLFKVYQTPADLDRLRGDKVTTKAWMDQGDKDDLRHSGKKMTFILRANKLLLDKYDGDVPKDRDELQAMNGVGRHVASITMAWCYQKAEFGIDVHVKRIMQRWGYAKEQDTDLQIEQKVKQLVPENQIGHFSRAFVDHGQQICGYTPNCSECYLKHSCPTASKYMDW